MKCDCPCCKDGFKCKCTEGLDGGKDIFRYLEHIQKYIMGRHCDCIKGCECRCIHCKE